MYILRDHRVCFLATPRTGSNAIAKALVGIGAELVGSHHSTPDDDPDIVDSSWTVMSTIRNHWDAMVSWWFKVERGEHMTPLAEFLPRFCSRNPNFVNSGRLYWQNTPFTNATLRYEWLASDLDYHLVGAGLCPVNLPQTVDSKRDGRPYQAFYRHNTTAKWVREYFAAEIQEYGYKF